MTQPNGRSLFLAYKNDIRFSDDFSHGDIFALELETDNREF